MGSKLSWSHFRELLIVKNLDDFLRQLGIGFTYIGNEYKIKLGSKYNYIDLLHYNIKYKFYAVVELKVTELKKEHTGQIMTYMNYIDKNIKQKKKVIQWVLLFVNKTINML